MSGAYAYPMRRDRPYKGRISSSSISARYRLPAVTTSRQVRPTVNVVQHMSAVELPQPSIRERGVALGIAVVGSWIAFLSVGVVIESIWTAITG